MPKIKICIMCGCQDVPDKELEYPVNLHGIVSVKLNGAECSKCGEKYYDLKDLQAIDEMKKAYDQHAVGA